ncbi:MAG: transcription-repair coupling factor [Actinomycetales bacterium]|nr:transcription-repair coupling factor [Actinomycetales bacterium]
MTSPKLRGLISLSETTRSLLDDSEATSLNAINSALPALLAYRSHQNPLVVVAHSSRRASEIASELRAFSDEVIEFPAWETLPHERLSPNGDTVARRIETLYRINDFSIMVVPVRAFVQPLMTSVLETPLLTLSRGDNYEFERLLRALTDRGYVRVDLVERRGDFAVRGGIVDVFLPLSDHPIRIEFFGDEIEEMRFFEIGDQRTFEPVTGKVDFLPCRELLIDEHVRARAKELRNKYFEVREICDKISEGIYVEGMESLAAALVPEMSSLIDLLPAKCEIFMIEEERIRNRTLDLIRTSQEFLEAAWSNVALDDLRSSELKSAPLREELQIAGYQSIEKLHECAVQKGLSWRTLNSFSDEQSESIDQFTAPHTYKGDIERLIADLQRWLKEGYLVALSLPGHGLVERYVELLSSADIPIKGVEAILSAPVRGTVYAIAAHIANGFVDVANKLVLLGENDITGVSDQRAGIGKMPKRRKKTIDPLELKAGDYVVHEIHGIGLYVELIERTIAGVQREYLVIEYAPAKRGQPADRIYVPTDSLELITRYIGADSPSVHKIGGGDWIKAKSRAKKAVKDIAGELIRLYAARRSSPGFAFSPDTTWQRELEDSFAYVETPDQLVTINEVKSDMERAYPMDRVVCGDVGYGKTEIAIRAAFKAVQDGKQVAVLVPTTLLVQQHFATFSQRYAGFPLTVRGLSRFNTGKEISETLAGLSSGAIDVVIGTHRLLSDDVKFRDLGLIVVDEEQRFGVEHKEKLKRLRATVDVLSMSATPIPRTLEMAITGIREMSTIATPPEERHPVLTYVGAYDEKQVVAAIHRELLRDGQVFYIHNRVESIDETALRLRRLIPEARVAIAHGQMDEGSLERVVLAFWNREFDILVCTTIVENGIDVANANTLIVERADMFGLSQLHQLRGRVGRSRERAYAYFLYPGDRPLSEVALDRLSTIARNTELGSGMQVALKDLEIRGAGNLLGGEQSGHIAEVGFDLYMRMVGEAVNDYKQGIVDGAEIEHECKVEIPISAHLSADYVPADRLRLDLYRRLADSRTSADVEQIREELEDRFGPLPKEALELLRIALLRTYLKSHGIRDLALQGKFLKISPVTLSESKQLRTLRLYPGSLVKSATSTLLIARPKESAWSRSEVPQNDQMRDTALLDWVIEAVESVLETPPTRST